MTTHAKLTDTQTTILKAAANRQDGNIEPFPPTLRGGARTRVIEGLLARGLVADADGRHLLTDAGYAVVGKRLSKFDGKPFNGREPRMVCGKQK